MLSIFYGESPNEVFDPDTFFDHTKIEDSWMLDPLVKEMILDVDKSEVLHPKVIESPVFGAMPPYMLSGGVKTLILIYKYDKRDVVFNATACGDNCAKWLLEIGKRKDVLVDLQYVMRFPDGEFEIKIENTGKIVHNFKEFVNEVFKVQAGVV